MWLRKKLLQHLSACDQRRYELLGHVGYHKNCTYNLLWALNCVGLQLQEILSILYIRESHVDADSGLQIDPPPVKAGQSITPKAELSVIIVMSACPMDIAPTNGPDKRSRSVRVKRLS